MEPRKPLAEAVSGTRVTRMARALVRGREKVTYGDAPGRLPVYMAAAEGERERSASEEGGEDEARGD